MHGSIRYCSSILRPDKGVRPRQLLAIALVAVLLAPGTFVRDAPPGRGLSDFSISPLAAQTPAGWPEGLTLEGAWQLESANQRFGGLSAMALESEATFLAWSDRGDLMRLPLPGSTGAAQFLDLPPARELTEGQDIESVVFDVETGTSWLGHETPNIVRRLDPDGTSHIVAVPEMLDWGANAGAEAMVRLPDGRFLALAEKRAQGALFAGDPVLHRQPLLFAFDRPAGWSPTDAAILPDGRMLILLRKVERRFPPFRAMLALADPDEIAAGKRWQLERFVELTLPDLMDNYEALAVKQEEDGALTIWVLSDDNLSAFQRTLLLRLRWEYGAATQTAREDIARAPLNASQP